MKSLKPDPKKKTLEPIPPKKPSTSKRAAEPPQDARSPVPLSAKKSTNPRSARPGMLPALSLSASPPPDSLKIVVNASSPIPPDSPHVTSTESPHLNSSQMMDSFDKSDRSPNLSHQDDRSSSGGPSPLVRSMSGTNYSASPMPDLVGITSNSSFDGRNSFDGTAAGGLARTGSRRGSMSNLNLSAGAGMPPHSSNTKLISQRLSVPGKNGKPGAGARRGQRRKSSQQIQTEAAKKILSWWRSAAMRRNLKFLVAFVRRFVAIQEKARLRRVNNVLRMIERRLLGKLTDIRYRKTSESRGFILAKNTGIVQAFILAYASRALVGKALADLRRRSAETILNAWRASPRYRRLRLLEEQEEFFVLHKQEAVERRELARRWLVAAVELKNSFSARTVQQFVHDVLYRERDADEALRHAMDENDDTLDDEDDDDSLHMSRSRADSPLLRRQVATKRQGFGSRAPSHGPSTFPSRSGSPTQPQMGGNLRSVPSTVRRRIRSMSESSNEDAVELTPLWLEHLHIMNPVDAHLEKVDDEFFHPERAQLLPCPGLKRKVCVSGSVIGAFWESWFLPLDGANVFRHQVAGRSSSANQRRSGFPGQSRKRTRFASRSESVRFIGSMASQSTNNRALSPTTKTRASPSSPFAALMRPPSSNSKKPISTDFSLSYDDTMSLELDIERLLIQERTTRLRIEGNAYRQVKDILEKMLTERHQELQDLLPHSQQRKAKEGLM